jgi:hypothetical protein
MKKYLVTELGFIGRLVRPGEIIEVDGDPPIGGLVPIEDTPEPVAMDEPKVVRGPRRPRHSAPPADEGTEADII